MTDGRTVWWAKDAAWWRRDGVLELLDDVGVVGPAVVDWLACEAKAQNAAGAVKSSYRAISRGLGIELSTVCPVVSRCVSAGLLDDFEEAGTKFTCRISGWKYEQDKAIGAAKKARQRAESQDSSGGPGDDGPGVSPSVPPSPPTGQDRTGQDRKVVSPSVVVGRARTELPKSPYDDFVDRIVGVLQRGVDGLTSDEPAKPPTFGAVDAVLTKHQSWSTPAIVEGVAIEVRSIAQSQNRAPNIVGLFDQKLGQYRSAA